MLAVIPIEAAKRVAALTGKGSPLQGKHRVYVDHTGVANYPHDYESRLVRAFPIRHNVRLWALEPHDLALTKLERSNDRDIRDVISSPTSPGGRQRGTEPRSTCGWRHAGRNLAELFSRAAGRGRICRANAAAMAQADRPGASQAQSLRNGCNGPSRRAVRPGKKGCPNAPHRPGDKMRD